VGGFFGRFGGLEGGDEVICSSCEVLVFEGVCVGVEGGGWIVWELGISSSCLLVGGVILDRS
jgi:hypothetical protein